VKRVWNEFRHIVALNLLSLTITVIPKDADGLLTIKAIREAVKNQLEK